MAQYGKVVRVSQSDNDFEFLITDGFSQKATDTFACMEACHEIAQGYSFVKKCVTEDNKFHLILTKEKSKNEITNEKAENQAAIVIRLDSLNVGDTYKYNPEDIGIFQVLAKDEENWIKTIRTQSGRITGGFPWTKVYPVNE